MRSILLLCLLFLMSPIGGCGPGAVDSKTYRVSHDGNSTKALVVFIHGVMGDAKETWASAGDPDGWPGIVVRDPKMPAVDALSLGYRSEPLNASSNIEEIAVRTLQSLQDEGVFNNYEQIAIVSHSMGGLITKRMLSLMKNNYPEQLKKVKLVVFFSTPSQGSNEAEMASWMSSNPQFRDMQPSDLNTFLQTLDNDWRSLLQQRTAQQLYPKSYCAYETLPTRSVRVVPRSRAEGNCDGTPIGFDRDHLTIAKPTSVDDELHRFLRARIISAFDQRAQPLDLKVDIIRNDGYVLPAQTGSLKSGESYSLALSASRDVWFYVFASDSTGKTVRYFPSSATGNQSRGLKSLRVPQDTYRFIRLDSVTGQESIYVFAIDDPDPELEKAFRDIDDKSIPEQKALLTSLILHRGGEVVAGEGSFSQFAQGATRILVFKHVD